MEIQIRPVTAENRQELLRLEVRKEQEGYIESVEACLAEAHERSDWKPAGIYDGKALVGFAMYGFFEEYPPKGRVWLDRILIDRRFQGKGYGREAVKSLLRRLEEEYGAEEIYLSVVKGNQAAEKLYEGFGFIYNGERDTHGEYVMVLNKKKERKQ